MTREQKNIKRNAKRKARKQKRFDELNKIRQEMWLNDLTFSQARSKVRRGWMPFRCEMNYGDCNERGYCNGDC